MTIYSLDLTHEKPEILSGHLRLGGTNPQGRSIAFTNYYMLRDGKPCIPVMGEMHFSRFDYRFWEDAILKIKAGGINILATYVFWIHIEEDEGVYDWSGNKNLRQFIELCSKHDLQVIVRIGPFAHGECRNGGLPDWLYGRSFELRSNDEPYLAYVERWYTAISQQLVGLLFKDNGPVIGIQLDNEYMHCGAPWEVTFRQGTEWVTAGSEGVAHMVKLKQLAIKAGLDVPIYTSTGWLHSPVIEDEILPMQGGYAFTPWSPDPNYVQPPTREFIFRNRHLDPVLNGKPTYDASRYPYACCEIGGGIQITYHHRPIVPPEAVESLALMNLAGGANLIGYYMYHGGTNPVGKHAFMNEFTVPRLSYDFQAPLREFGQVAPSYRYLRLLHLFLHDFGDILAPMPVVLPENQTQILPEDTQTLRYMVRSDGNTGFVFLNNYQDHIEMQDITHILFRFNTQHGMVEYPEIVLQKNVSMMLPFNLDLDGVVLRYATTQLLCKLESENLYVFFAPHGISAEYAFEKSTYETIAVEQGVIETDEHQPVVKVTPGKDCIITLRNGADKTLRILTLSREQAEQCSKLTLWGKKRLLLSHATITSTDESCILHSIGHEVVRLAIYPAFEGELRLNTSFFSRVTDGIFTTYTVEPPQIDIQLDVQMIMAGKAFIQFPLNMFANVHNLLLHIDYVGDIGNAYIDGKLVHDNFYNGQVWEIGLKQIVNDKDTMVTVITPTAKNIKSVPTGMAFRPDEESTSLAVINNIKVIPEYRLPLELC